MFSKLKIKFKKTHPYAVLPQCAHAEKNTGDTGADLVAIEQVTIPARDNAVVSVGLTLAYITPGYWFRIEARSGLGFKHSIFPHFGIIDNTYKGDLGVKLYNNSDKDYVVNRGDKIAQIVVYKLHQPAFSFVDEVEIKPGDRGDKGFGSTG